MSADDARAWLDRARRARGAELQNIIDIVRADPDLARAIMIAVFSSGADSADSAALLALVVKVACMQLIAIEAAKNDRFSIQVAELIIEGANELATPPQPPGQRGQSRKVDSA